MKRTLLIFSLIGGLTLNSAPLKAWDKKDTALLVAAVSFLGGGELIRHAYNNRKGLWEFVKSKPHFIIAGVSLALIGVRAYKGIVFDPILDYLQPNKIIS